MGKRKKSSRKPPPSASKRRGPLETQFSCIFCNHEKSVSCKIDKKDGIGHLLCKICGQTFQTRAHHLTEPVDIFSDWVDSAEAVSKLQGTTERPAPASATGGSNPKRPRSATMPSAAAEDAPAPNRRFVQEDSDGD